MGGNKRYPRDPYPDPERRHCWVMQNEERRGPWPGLILYWQRLDNEEWRAFVVYSPNQARPEESVQQWLPRGWIRPVVTDKPITPGRASGARPDVTG